jgi:hypothetical protein
MNPSVTTRTARFLVGNQLLRLPKTPINLFESLKRTMLRLIGTKFVHWFVDRIRYVGTLEKRLQEEFDNGLRGIPWVLEIVAGSVPDISHVTSEEFQVGLITLIGVIHRNTLHVAKEIDRISD